MDGKRLLEVAKSIHNIEPEQISKYVDDIRESYNLLKEDYNTLGNSLYHISMNIMNMGEIKPQSVQYYEQIIDDVIKCSIQNYFQVGYDALKNIFNSSAEFYKKNNIDNGMKYPLGKQRPLTSYKPSVGQQCDVVRPYITSTSYCGWVRCTVLQIEGNKYTIQYANTSAPITVRQQPFFSPLGTRTTDYDWRMNLDMGSPVEAQSNRVWYESTVVASQIQNGCKKVQVSFRRFAENGDRQDSNGNKYFGLGPNQDQWMDVFSPRIQQNGKMADKKLCYYTATSQQILLDDHYDIVFQQQYNQKPFHGIMRNVLMKSLSYIRFMNTFTENKGFERYFEVAQNPNPNFDVVFFMQANIGCMVQLIPRMDIHRYLPKTYEISYRFFKNNAKILTGYRIQQAYFCIDVIGRRLFSLTEVYKDQNQIRKHFMIIFLKMNMQKQMLALRYLYDLINPKKPYTTQQRQELNQFIIKQRLFYEIFQIQKHEQILSRTPALLKYLMEKGIVKSQQIQYLWNLAPYSDQRNRAIIEKLLSDVSKQLPIEIVEKLLDKLLDLKQTDLTFDNLNLLRQLKNRQIQPEYQLRILTYLWDIITTKSYNIKTNIEEEVEKVFKVFVGGIKSPQMRANVLESMINRLTETKKLKNQVDLLKDFINSYPEKIVAEVQPTNAPLTIYDAINYLKNKNIYEKILNLVTNSKKDQVVAELLKFLGFLFQYDKQDASHIIKPIYDKFGPSDILLEWIHKNMDKAQVFIEEMLNNYDNINGFANLSTSGFQALSQIIISMNERKKNLKIMTTYKFNVNDSGNNSKNAETQTVQNKPEGQKMIGPVLPNKVKHLYILVSPFQLIGMKFLSNLLHILKNSKVYDQAVKLIIKFIVSLDDSITEKTLQFRKEFLSEIIKQIEKIYEKNQLNDQIKQKLQVYINLLIQIFSQTEKYGLGNITPHFEKLIGEKLSFNVENTFTQQKEKRIEKFTLIMNQNDTLWKLKLKVAEIIKQQPYDIDIIKFVNPVDDAYMGKSLTDLFFYDGEGIKVAKKPVRDVPKHNLLNQDGTDLSQRFHQIVVNWFDQFKNKDNNITLDDLKSLAEIKWKGSLLRQPDKLQKIMEQHDKDKKGYLTFDEFKDFYYTKSVKNENAVWKLIHLSGFKNNLRLTVNEDKTVNPDILPRRILSSPEVYELIFKIFRNQTFESIQLNFYRLLSQLEVDSQTQKQIQGNIYNIIDQSESIYEFCYAIQVANSSISLISDYFYEFWKNNGCVKVLNRIRKITKDVQNIYKLEIQIKNTVLPHLFKNINFYMKYIFSDRAINRFASTLKLNIIDTDQLLKKYEKFKENEEDIKDYQAVRHKLIQIHEQKNHENFYRAGIDVLDNLIKNFTSDSTDFLPKLTVEVVRMISYQVLGKPQVFDPLQFVHGSKSQSLNYRRTTANIIILYIKQHSVDAQKLLMKLIQEMPNQSKHIYGNYFSFLSKIVQFYLQKYLQSKQKDQFFNKLANDLLDRLFQKIEGQSRTALLGDKIIFGILSTVLVLLKKQSVGQALKHRKHQITQKCLFSYGIQQKIKNLQVTNEMLSENKQSLHFKDYVKCKTDETRSVTYDIVNKLHKLTAHEDKDFIEKFIFPIFNTFKQEIRLTDSRSLSIGLKNFGSTCYMNSMLQVLNAVGPFRSMLLQANSNSQLVKQLQKTFSALFFSERLDYAPRKVLESFIPPINPGIQQDTTQFLNLLFDQLQSGLSNTEYKKLLDEIFKGATIAQMICSKCGYKKQNRQEFFAHSIQIDGKLQLSQALQHSHEGQIISDYQCDSCQQRVDMKKRNLLSEVPNIFFIHLRRIVFNYDMFVNMKIHTRLEFPNQLNIQPYTKEGVELRQSLGLQYLKGLTHNQEQMKKFQEMTLHGKQKDYYKLKLKGVIVHSGSADVGHYYSILSTNKNNNTWYKFDDSRVSVFTLSGFQSQCYGGSFQTQQWGGFGSSVNAYFLVYEKQIKKPIKIFKTLQQNQQNIIQQQQLIEYNQSKTYNTVQQYKQIWLDNHNFMVETHLLQQNHAKAFIKFVQQLLQEQTCTNKIKLISQIMYKLAIHSEQCGKLEERFQKCIKQIVSGNQQQKSINQITPDIFYDYIIADKKKTFKLLFSHNKNVRRFMGKFLAVVMFRILETTTEQKTKKQIYEFISQYIHNMTGQIAKNWLRIDGFFVMIDYLVISSERNQQLWDFLMNYHFVSLLIDFVMEKISPVKISPKNYSLGTKTNPVDFSVPLRTIAYLIKHSYGFNGENYQLPQISQQRLFHLNDNDIICLGFSEFYRKVLKQRQNTEALATIIQRLCIKNLPFSYMICEALLTIIGSNTDMNDDMRDLSSILLEIMKIKDQFWRNRAQMLLGVSNPYVLQKNLMTTLDQQRYIFTSTIYDIFPVQCLFSYAYLYRLKNTLACFYLVKAILQGCSVTPGAMNYLIQQPSFSYYYASYLDWMEQFVMSVTSIKMGEKTLERVQHDQKEALKYIQDYKDFISKEGNPNQYFSVITGDYFNKKQILTLEKDGVEVNIYEYQVNCLDSQPAYTTNTALDTYLNGGRLTKPISNQSTLLKFMKNPTKSLALKAQAVEEDEDKQLVGLFDEQYPDNTAAKTYPQPMQIQNQPAKQKQQAKKQQQNKVQQNKQQIPAQIPETININNFYINNYYRQIEILNKSKAAKFVRFQFLQNQQPSNMILPLSFEYKISTKSNEKMWISKQNPYNEWSPISFNLNVEDYIKEKHDKNPMKINWFKLYGYQQIAPVQEIPIAQPMIDQKDQNHAQNKGNTDQGQVKQINCPLCTFLNLSINDSCEVCGQSLK